MKSPTRLLDIVGQVRRGEVKLSDVRPGIRKAVDRLSKDKSITDEYFKRPEPSSSPRGSLVRG